MIDGLPHAKILVIDNDQKSLVGLRAMLAGVLGNTETAASLPMAVELACNQPIDLIVCDESSCNLNGEFFDSQLFQTTTSSIVFLSALQKADITFKRLPGGSFYCLRKPVSSDLLTLISKLAVDSHNRKKKETQGYQSLHYVLPPINFGQTATVSNIHTMY